MTLENPLMILVMFGLPAYVVFRLGWRGIFFGAPFIWGLGCLMAALEQIREPHESLAIAVWIVSGWLVGLVYCLLVLGVRQLARFIRQKIGKCETVVGVES